MVPNLKWHFNFQKYSKNRYDVVFTNYFYRITDKIKDVERVMYNRIARGIK